MESAEQATRREEGGIRTGSREKIELNLDCGGKGRSQKTVGRRNHLLGKGNDVRERLVMG